MFSCSSLRATRSLSRCSRHFPRRTIFTETIQTLSTAYLDLAIALPYPPTWPVYSSTIVLVGVASRLALLPVTAWARKRERRVEEHVVPYLKAYRAKLEQRARQEAAKANNQAVRDYLDHIVRQKLQSKRDELFKAHNCTPWITTVVPPLSQIPVFVTLSATFFHAARESSSVLRDEGFFTLPSLAHPDPTLTLPILLGFVSLATVESSTWFMTEERARKIAEQKRRDELQRARGKLVIQPTKYIKGILRGLSVGRIVLAAMAPGSIEIYWLTSATFGLCHNWAMNWADYRRKEILNRTLLGPSNEDSGPKGGGSDISIRN